MSQEQPQRDSADPAVPSTDGTDDNILVYTTTVAPRLTYTVPEAASILGISRGLGYEMARRGELPVVRFGRRLVVPCVALERLLEGNPDGPRSETGKRL